MSAIVTTGGVAKTIRYLNDTNTAYVQVVEERDENGVLQARYDNGDGDTQKLYRRRESDGLYLTRWYLNDGLESTRQLVDANGVVTDSYAYDAFGSTLQRAGETENTRLYNGQQQDDSGLYFLRARYYNSGNGRFLSHDPLLGNSDDPVTLHRYLYCANDPINGTDPSGRETLQGMMSAMGSYTSMVGRGLSTTYNAYDKADTTREIVEFIGTFVTTGTFSPTAAAQLALTLLPGNIPGADKIVGRVADAKGLLAERLGDFSGIAKRVAGVTDGIPSSTKLGANMREARGLTRTGGWTSFQAHHIIPKEFRSHAVIQRLNMYMDDASNGIFLPDPSKLPRPTTLGPGLSDHDDFHRMYNNFVSTKLNEIDVNLPVDQLERQVFELQQKLGVMCESGASLYHHPDFFERLYNTLQ